MGPQKNTARRKTSRLTDTSIRALTPRAQRYEAYDPSCPGLQLRVEPTGTKSWLFRFYWQGKRQRIALGTYPAVTLARAHKEAGKARDLLEHGIDPRRAERYVPGRHTPAADPSGDDRHSVANLAREFMDRHVRPHRKHPEYIQRILDIDVLPTWGGRDARTIRPREVVELLDGIVARGSRVMANRVAHTLSQMFRFGIHRQLVEASPVQLLYKPGGREKPRDRALSDQEITTLLAKLESVMGTRSPQLVHVIRILLLTGQRRGELGRARWRDLDLDAKEPTWTIPAENSKTGEPHVVPLLPWAREEFLALRRYAGRSAYVLPDTEGAAAANPKLITRSVARYRKALEKLGIAAFTPHDLRRTCRTGMAKLSVLDEVAERLLNHVPLGMRGVYNRHRYATEMRAALQCWESYLLTLGKARAIAA